VSERPLVSIVIPTHNRAARLLAALDALARQDWSDGAFETIVVADGCTDATREAVGSWRAPFPLRLVEQPGSGPAVARNRGAADASGRYLLFLDDDIQAGPGLVGAHVAAHASGPRQVVIGYLPARVAGAGLFAVTLRGWWDAMFQAMRKPGHRFTFRDLLSGNFSLERRLFDEVGGFEARLRCHEDYELGLRLLEAGAAFRFAPDAAGLHDERTTLEDSFARKFEEGGADIWLMRRRPGLAWVLPLFYMQAASRRRRLLRRLALAWPAGGDALARWYRWRLGAFECVRLRYRWRATLEDLLFYWYWRGVAAVVEPGELETLRRSAERRPAGGAPLDLDLREGLEAAERRLDCERPAALHLRYGPHPVGEVPAVPGSENLRAAHLRPLLAEPLFGGYFRALALTDELPPFIDVARVLAECPPPRISRSALPASFAT
jgi:glycosyltransferase involved in cell wall biosynthesis